MPYNCRYCTKEIIVDPVENRTLFFVKDKKGNYGKEFECGPCYRGRVVGPMSNRDSYRAAGEKPEEYTEDKYKNRSRSDYVDQHIKIGGYTDEEAEIAYKNKTGHAD